MTKWITPALLAMAVTACSDDAAKKSEGAGTAQGEILPGSASDAMIPLDSVKSQAPLAPKAESSAKAGDKAEVKPASAKVDAAVVAEPAAAPAEEPISE